VPRACESDVEQSALFGVLERLGSGKNEVEERIVLRDRRETMTAGLEAHDDHPVGLQALGPVDCRELEVDPAELDPDGSESSEEIR
jgi:hypothetical protein